MTRLAIALIGLGLFLLSGCAEDDLTVNADDDHREAPDAVREATAVAFADRVELAWENPNTKDEDQDAVPDRDRDFDGVLVLRREADRPLDVPVRGVDYVAGALLGDSDVVYVGKEQAFTDTGVTKGRTFVYAVFANDRVPNYGAPSFVEATPGSSAKARFAHTATPLGDGRLLVAGGVGYGAPQKTAEVFDPETGAFAPLESAMRVERFGHAATRLMDGRVLITGGYQTGFTESLRSATVFDPATDRFAALSAEMTGVRALHTQTLLPDGRVLVLGGSDGDLSLDTGELFDPAAGTFTALAATMAVPRASHTATLLTIGGEPRVLIAGGFDGEQAVADAELLDPATLAFSALPPMTVSRLAHTATALPGEESDRVLLCGGFSGNSLTGAPTAACDLFTMSDEGGAFAAGPAMTVARSGHDAATLADGRVLLAGGIDGDLVVLDDADLFDPAADTLVAVGAMVRARTVPRLSVLADGAILVTGGNASGLVFDPRPVSSAETFSVGTQSFAVLVAP
jgi:hypothetical protein